jgi:hypothetical protein
MEYIDGTHTSRLSRGVLATKLAAYPHVAIDIGTGDGRYVKHLAMQDPTTFVVGIDACREQLQRTSRSAPQNTLFVVANAFNLSDELVGSADRLIINFPWGSLLHGLLNYEPGLVEELYRMGKPGATLELRVNADALLRLGLPLLEGAMLVRQVLRERGFVVGALLPMDGKALRACPTTWAKRLAFGRNPHALYLHAKRPALATVSGSP